MIFGGRLDTRRPTDDRSVRAWPNSGSAPVTARSRPRWMTSTRLLIPERPKRMSGRPTPKPVRTGVKLREPRKDEQFAEQSDQGQSPVDLDSARTNRCGRESMFGLIERGLNACDDQSAVLILLFEAGYFSADEGSPWLTCGRVLESSTVGEVPYIAYTIDLSTEPPAPVLPKGIAAYVERLVAEPA